MSIHISDQNSGLFGTATTYLTLPSGAANKGANIASVFGIFFQSPILGLELNQPARIACRATGSGGGNDAYFYLNNTCTDLSYSFRNGGITQLSGVITGLTAGKKYLLLFIINPTYSHVIAAPVDGGAALVSSVNTSTPYTTNMTTNAVITSLGGASSAYAWYGPLENAFFLHGAFPESSGVPNATLITNLATGVQDINTLDAQLTGGVKKFWYPMRHNRDLSDKWGIASSLVITGEDKPTGKFHFNGKQLRPEALIPNDADFVVSQAIFATKGDMSTAKADVPVQGGTYTGSPAAIQARLVKEDGTTLVDWTTIDSNLSGGTWDAGVIPNVPMTAGLLNLDIRAVDGSNNQIGDITSGGIRGVGGHMLGTGQSQRAYYDISGLGLAIPSGSRLINHRADDTATRRVVLGSASAIDRWAKRGIRQALIEWNTLFPGVPLQIDSIAEPGKPIDDFITGGAHVGRWSRMASAYGVIGPMYIAPMGHSSNAFYNYEANFTAMMAIVESIFPNQKILCMPVPRYKRSGTALLGDAGAVHGSRLGMRNWHEANKTKSYWVPSFTVITTENEGNSNPDPHPGDNNTGQGRAGSIMALGLMCACGAIEDISVKITSVTGLGTNTHTLVFGKTNL